MSKKQMEFVKHPLVPDGILYMTCDLCGETHPADTFQYGDAEDLYCVINSKGEECFKKYQEQKYKI